MYPPSYMIAGYLNANFVSSVLEAFSYCFPEWLCICTSNLFLRSHPFVLSAISFLTGIFFPFLIIVIVTGVGWYLRVDWICVSLMRVRLSIHSSAWCFVYFLLRNVCSGNLLIFKIGYFSVVNFLTYSGLIPCQHLYPFPHPHILHHFCEFYLRVLAGI